VKWLCKLLVVLVLAIALVSGCEFEKTTSDDSSQHLSTSSVWGPTADEKRPASRQLIVHFIDVGQGDCILVQFPNGKVMLIDAGDDQNAPFIVDYLREHRIRVIDYLVATHPHADHIGGLDEVIEAFDIGKVYMPRVTHTTRSFQEVLLSLQRKELAVTAAEKGVLIVKDRGVEARVLAPGASSYEDLNDYSAVIRVVYGSTAFLFTGDAGKTSEQQMIESGSDLRADVLKVAHHGSSDATTEAFLQRVSPKYAVISVGRNNDYGHPHRETLDALSRNGIQVYRTDIDGTIVFSSDGEQLAVNN